MARNLTPEMVTAVQAGTVRPFLMAKIETGGGDVRVWSGLGDLVFNSETYIGTGEFGSVSPVNESDQLKVSGINFQLTGIPGSIVSSALNDMKHGKSAQLWIAFFDEATGNIVDDPYELFAGVTDIPSLSEGPETSTLSVSAVNRLAELERKRERRYTKEDQVLTDPTDLGFDMVPALQDMEILFGKSR